jgi:hypothetical protein
MKATFYSETSAGFQQTTQRYNSNGNCRCDNLESYKIKFLGNLWCRSHTLTNLVKIRSIVSEIKHADEQPWSLHHVFIIMHLV